MSTTSEDTISNLEGKSPEVRPGNYSPVTVYLRDSLGAIFLGFLSGVLLIGWTRAEARYRALLNESN